MNLSVVVQFSSSRGENITDSTGSVVSATPLTSRSSEDDYFPEAPVRSRSERFIRVWREDLSSWPILERGLCKPTRAPVFETLKSSPPSTDHIATHAALKRCLASHREVSGLIAEPKKPAVSRGHGWIRAAPA